MPASVTGGVAGWLDFACWPLDALEDERDALADADAHRAQRVAAAGRGAAGSPRSSTSRAPLAPSGWPSAIAPPFGLTRASSSGRPRSRSTARPCAANASLSSITSICVERQAGQREHLARRRRRADAHDARRHAGGGHADDARARRQAVPARRRPRSASSSAQAPSLTPEALPAVTRAVGPHHALELGQRLERGLARMLVLARRRSARPSSARSSPARSRRRRSRVFCAATAFCCDASAMRSCASRSIL